MSDTPQETKTAYRVLARKYRPSDFTGLIGQEALVRILSNAIASGRIAQAFMLTGVRGVGKTTTARIIAKALNCTGGEDGAAPTANPCGTCDNCIAIAADRHVDVQELDAASRTGVDDIRELIDGVRYRPTSARYKVYILDEVHMLSRNAFNALLKTLEEPPEHVKFIFATTDIRKVPVTVLSRCQRFDLRRVPIDRLFEHFRWVLTQEAREADDEALAMVARAADGSVRDGLSILDQAVALSDGKVTAEQVRDMLGLADRAQSWDLFDALMAGQAADALDIARAMYDAGADPVVVVQDLLDLSHWVTRLKLSPALADQAGTPELEKTRGRALAEKLPMPALLRCWQMLLKGLSETQNAPNPIQALEMVLIRLLHVADLPPPGDLVRRLQDGQGAAGSPSAPAPPPSGNGAGAPAGSASAAGQMRVVSRQSRAGAAAATAELAERRDGAPDLAAAPMAEEPVAAEATPDPASPAPAAAGDRLKSFDDLLTLVEEKREGRLYKNLVHDVHLVRFEPGRIELRPTSAAPTDLCHRLMAQLANWLDERWVVTVSSERGEATVAEQRAAAERARFDAAAQDPLVQRVMQEFPGARIKTVTPPADAVLTDETEAVDADQGVPVDPDDYD